MKTRITPYYIDLVCDAALKSFWRKRTLRKFLKECKIFESFLSTWSADETKRDFLDRLFEKLLKTTEGRKALIRMAEYLVEQKSFPDLENWEDSDKKISDALKSVERLKIYHDKQEVEITKEQEKKRTRNEFKKHQEEITRSQETIKKLSDRLNELGKRLGSQRAGYDFQDWFFDLLDFFEIQNRRPYAHKGRQIDGSLTHEGTTYLVELKFTSEQAAVNDIDTFHKKVTTKADNTMGVMVSISGYSSTARKEASGEKTPLLLLDYNHVYLTLSGVMSMGELVERIRRHASQTGEAYLAVGDF